MIKKDKDYLGDGLYAECNGFHLVLTAENGISAHDTVYLEDSVLSALLRYLDLKVVQNGESENE
jgi:hypothetical protein